MGKTRAEAVEKANEELARWESGLDRDAGNKTLAQFLSEFLAYYKRDGGIAPSTCQDYRYHVESHIVPALGKVALKDLDPRKVDEFMRSLNEKGRSNFPLLVFRPAASPSICGGLEIYSG